MAMMSALRGGRSGVAAALLGGIVVTGAWAGPVYEGPDDVPAAMKFDLLMGGAFLGFPLPVVPDGTGMALVASTLTGKDPTYRAEVGYLLRTPTGNENIVTTPAPQAGTFKVPQLSGDGTALSVDGKGALRVDETVPRTVTYTMPDGTRVTRDAVARSAGAGGVVAEVESATEGMLVFSESQWFAARDTDPAMAGNQSGLAQAQIHMIARSEHGPELDAVAAGVSENRFAGLPRGAVALRPEITLDLTTTLGLPDLPKPGREGRAIFSFEGLASFSPDPLWSWVVEYRPDGTVLQRFTSSAAMRQADDLDARLDDAAVQDTLKGLLRIDDKGVLSTAGVIDIANARLFDAQIASPRRFDYTQRTTVYLAMTVPEPDSVLLLLAAVVGGLLVRRQPVRRRRMR